MHILELKNKFRSELSNIFPENEIDSFFYLLSNSYLNVKKVDIALQPDLEIHTAKEAEFNSALAKLKKEIPIQYILGETEFYGLPFKVDKNVLIPRPETEELIEWIIQEVQSLKFKVKSEKADLRRQRSEVRSEKFKVRSQKSEVNIIDIGTGSGCIAVSLAKNISNAKVWALDISEKAIAIARQNAELNKVDIHFLIKNILNINHIPYQFDIIVSNPPYVRELEKQEIDNNVLHHEPHLALFVKDEDPLLFYDKISDFALKHLNKNGTLFFEINQYLANETIVLLKKKGFSNIELKKDMFNNDRMIKAKI